MFLKLIGIFKSFADLVFDGIVDVNRLVHSIKKKAIDLRKLSTLFGYNKPPILLHNSRNNVQKVNIQNVGTFMF